MCCLRARCLFSLLNRLFLCFPPCSVPLIDGAECRLVFGVVRLGEMPAGTGASAALGSGCCTEGELMGHEGTAFHHQPEPAR